MQNRASQAKVHVDPSLVMAVVVAILKSRRQQKLSYSSSSKAADPAHNCVSQTSCSNSSESDAIKWKRKAKQRKEEIRKLEEDLKIAEDVMQHDLFPQNISCKCYFFDNLGELSSKVSNDGPESDQKRFNDVLRRRFLRQVRLSERKRRRRDDSSGLSSISAYCSVDYGNENYVELLKASVDFLVELCETSSPVRVEEGNFKTWSHQSVDFILNSLKALLSLGKMDEAIESILSGLIVRLLRRLYSAQEDELNQSQQNFELYVQHLMRKLGSVPSIGQRVILSVSERISLAAESLLFMDPFDSAFPRMHNFMYIMIQLVEFLISDYLQSWSTSPDFDIKLMEEWVLSIFRARKALELLESRNTLYMLYMDRVVGELTRQLGQVSFVQKLKPDTLAKLFG